LKKKKQENEQRKGGYLPLPFSALDCLSLIILINQESCSMDTACLHFLNAATPVVPPPAKLSNTISQGLVNISTSPQIRNSGFSVGCLLCLFPLGQIL
jgi:hypothetical protein